MIGVEMGVAEEVDELAGHGVNWIWTSVPARTLESYLDIVRWFGEEVIAAYNKR